MSTIGRGHSRATGLLTLRFFREIGLVFETFFLRFCDLRPGNTGERRCGPSRLGVNDDDDGYWSSTAELLTCAVRSVRIVRLLVLCGLMYSVVPCSRLS